MSFLLLECTIAVAVLLALAELVSWWAVPLLPVLVAAVVKINDMVGSPSSRRPARAAVGGGRHDDPEDLHDDRFGVDGFTDDRYEDGGHDGYEPAGYADDRRDEHPGIDHDGYGGRAHGNRGGERRGRDDRHWDDRHWDERRLDRNWNDRHRHRDRRPEPLDGPAPESVSPVEERVPAYAGARLPDDATQEMSLPSTLTGRPRQRQGGYAESYEQQAAFVTDSYPAPAPVSAAETAEFSIADLDVALAAGDPRVATGQAGHATSGDGRTGPVGSTGGWQPQGEQGHQPSAYPAQQYGAEQYGGGPYGAEQYGGGPYGAEQYGGRQYQAHGYQAPHDGGPQYQAEQYGGRQYQAAQYEGQRYAAPQQGDRQYENRPSGSPPVPAGPAGYGPGTPAPDESAHYGAERPEAGRHAAAPDTVTLDPAALGPAASVAAPQVPATPGTGTGGSLAAAGGALTSGRGGFTTGVPGTTAAAAFPGGRPSGFAERQPGTRPRFGGPEERPATRRTAEPETPATRTAPAGQAATADDRPREGSRAAGYWTRAAGEGGSGSGDRQRPAEGAIPTGLPGSGAPRRVQILGAAVRRSMAVQAQQFGVGGSGRGTTRGNGTRGGAESARGGGQSGSPGANHGGSHGNGRAARDTGHEPGGGNTSGRHARGETVVRFNERGLGRLRDA